jgi:hypothetical protein
MPWRDAEKSEAPGNDSEEETACRNRGASGRVSACLGNSDSPASHDLDRQRQNGVKF